MEDDYEWDEAKRLSNVEKHGLDFVDAGAVFEGPHLVRPSKFPDEERYIALGRILGRGVAVIFAHRRNRRRIICVRRARSNEQKALEAFERQTPAVKD